MMTDRVIFVCTIVVAAVYLYATTLIPTLEIGDPLGPKAFPRLLGICLLIGAGLLFIEIWKERKAQVPQTGGSETATWRHLGMVAGVTAGTGIYYAAFEPLGYIVSTAIYLFALMAWFNRGKWTANVLSAVLFSILSFIMFVKLDVNLPRGLAAFSWVSDAVVAILNPIVNGFKAVLALFQSGGPR
jgi:putative tricarboxylic transport membrane protein